MKIYVDTSVIISAYKPNEKAHNLSLRIANLDGVSKVGSYTLIAELIAVISRLYGSSQVRLPSSLQEILSKLRETERSYALVNAMIADWNISFPTVGFEAVQLNLGGVKLPVPEVVAEACSIAPLLLLKTLDLMHIAGAKIINDSSRDLKYFVTLDKDILNCRDKIRSLVGFQTLSPEEFLNVVQQ